MHFVQHPAVHCVPCSVSAAHTHHRGAVRHALHTMLQVHPRVVPCLLFPVPLHPLLPAPPALWGGGGETRSQRKWGRLPPCPKPAAKMLPKTSGNPRVAVPVARRGGVICCRWVRWAHSARTSGRGHHVAVGRGRHPGQPPRLRPSGTLSGPLRRRQHCGRQSGPPQPCARLLPPSGPPVSTCRPGPRRSGRGACPRPLCPSCPTPQHRLIPQPSCRQRRHEGEPCSAHWAPTDPLPLPCHRGRCSSAVTPGACCAAVIERRGAMLASLLGGVGNRSLGSVPPPAPRAGCGPACTSGAPMVPSKAGPSLATAAPYPPWPRRMAAPAILHTGGPRAE